MGFFEKFTKKIIGEDLTSSEKDPTRQSNYIQIEYEGAKNLQDDYANKEKWL